MQCVCLCACLMLQANLVFTFMMLCREVFHSIHINKSDYLFLVLHIASLSVQLPKHMVKVSKQKYAYSTVA